MDLPMGLVVLAIVAVAMASGALGAYVAVLWTRQSGRHHARPQPRPRPGTGLRDVGRVVVAQPPAVESETPQTVRGPARHVSAPLSIPPVYAATRRALQDPDLDTDLDALLATVHDAIPADDEDDVQAGGSHATQRHTGWPRPTAAAQPWSVA